MQEGLTRATSEALGDVAPLLENVTVGHFFYHVSQVSQIQGAVLASGSLLLHKFISLLLASLLVQKFLLNLCSEDCSLQYLVCLEDAPSTRCLSISNVASAILLDT